VAIDQDLLDDAASSVADLYRELESALNQRIAQRLRADLDSPYELGKLDAVRKLQRSAQLLVATLQAARTKAIRDAIARAYRDGHGSALTGIPEKYWPKSGIGQAAREGQREIPNAPVIENIAAALHRDLGRVEGNILRNVADAYRAVQAAAAARITSGAFTRRQAAQAAWQRLVDRGVTSFVDSAGRRWRLSSYAEMMTRTNAARAAVQGQTDRLTGIGVDLVIVSDHAQECKLCRPFEGKVLTLGTKTGRISVEHATRDGETVTVNVVGTLDGARAKGLMHPNCRHSTSAYLPGVTKQPTNTADPEGDKARQRQREIERNIRRYKDRAETALTPEAKKQAEARTREWQREMRDHLAANPKLKRLRYREQPGAGNTPPKGGQPPGGPTGDLEPPVQPPLPDAPGAQRTVPRTAKPPRPDEQARRREEERQRAEAEDQAQREAEERAERAAKEAAEKARRDAEERAEKARRRAPGMKDGVRHRSNEEGLEWARKHMPLPDDLTDAEKQALHAYTGDDYRFINAARRKGAEPYYESEIKRYRENFPLLQSAFRKSKLRESLIVHRGANGNLAERLGADINDAAKMHALVGKVFDEKGALSTSVGDNAAFDGEIHLMIRVPEGHEALNVMPISREGEGEREILIRFDSRYVVHSVYQRNKVWHIEVEIVPDDWTPPPGWQPDPHGDADRGYDDKGKAKQ
jgi:minor capsid protein 2/ADP-ribosyltransferase exoenzyme